MFDITGAFKDITKGNNDALEFIARFYVFVHAQDDLVDKDKPDPGHALHTTFELFDSLASNPFFQKHKEALKTAILTSFLAYNASERLRTVENVIDRITAQVLKGEYLNVFLTTAYLVGGFGHAEEMSKKYRNYHFDVEPVQP